MCYAIKLLRLPILTMNRLFSSYCLAQDTSNRCLIEIAWLIGTKQRATALG